MNRIFRVRMEEELLEEQLLKFIKEHRDFADAKWRPLMDAYINKYETFASGKKEDWIAVSFAKHIVDTMNGFFIGEPIEVTSDEEETVNYLNMLNRYNALDDHNAELSKLCSIFGRGYEMYFVDEKGNIVITFVSPMNAFMIYDDSIVEKPKYFVRTYVDCNDVFRGTLYTESHIRNFFLESGSVIWEEEKLHGFDGVPATEFIENRERVGLLYSVMPMLIAYNKAVSEIANSVGCFVTCLKMLEAALDEREMKKTGLANTIGFSGVESDESVIEYLQKLKGDLIQENIIDRLEKLIFQILMVDNANDGDVCTSSRIALQYKLQSMKNLAKIKERKFMLGMNRRYRLIFSNPVSKMKKDDWMKIQYYFSFPCSIDTRIRQKW